MNFALTLTPYKDRAFDTISIPLGLAWLYSYLSREIPSLDIEIFDFLLEPELEDSFYEQIRGGRYDVVGIQAHSNATAHEAVRIAKLVKSINTHIRIIIGGNAATFAPTYFLASKAVDFVVFGEGELTLKELLTKLNNREKDFGDVNGIAYLSEKGLVKTPARELIRDLNSLPLPDRTQPLYRKIVFSFSKAS